MTYYLHNNHTIRETSACPGEGVYCKPQLVAVIPVEDREQIARLITEWQAVEGAGRTTLDRWQAALREFADPKPPEPGVGGMVETRDGKEWVHVNVPKAPWMYRGQWAVYSDLDVARVIAQGVQP